MCCISWSYKTCISWSGALHFENMTLDFMKNILHSNRSVKKWSAAPALPSGYIMPGQFIVVSVNLYVTVTLFYHSGPFRVLHDDTLNPTEQKKMTGCADSDEEIRGLIFLYFMQWRLRTNVSKGWKDSSPSVLIAFSMVQAFCLSCSGLWSVNELCSSLTLQNHKLRRNNQIQALVVELWPLFLDNWHQIAPKHTSYLAFISWLSEL